MKEGVEYVDLDLPYLDDELFDEPMTAEECLEDTKLPQLPKMPQGVRESIEHGANGVIWLHFAVRPQGNRRKINFL